MTRNRFSTISRFSERPPVGPAAPAVSACGDRRQRAEIVMSSAPLPARGRISAVGNSRKGNARDSGPHDETSEVIRTTRTHPWRGQSWPLADPSRRRAASALVLGARWAPRRCVRPLSRTSIGDCRLACSRCSRISWMSSAVRDTRLPAPASRRVPPARARATTTEVGARPIGIPSTVRREGVRNPNRLLTGRDARP